MSAARRPVAKRCAAWLFLVLAAAISGGARASADRIAWSDFEAGLSAPAQTWTWIDFPDSECANGSATGIGVNLSSLSDRVLIFLDGGGACWDYVTCYLTPGIVDNLDGYGAGDFAGDVPFLETAGQFFDRADDTNPFKDYSYVVVPYCTGDVFAGDHVIDLSFNPFPTKTTHFVGYRNMTKFLKRLSQTFPTSTRIVLAGSSAGGFGATFNWWQAQNAFPRARVDVINDSGAIMPDDAQPNTFEQAQRTSWNLAATFPPGCGGCATAFDAVLGFYADVFPDNRGALLTYNPDDVISSFYFIDASVFSPGLAELEAQRFDPTTNLRYFEAAATGHVLWIHPDDVLVNGTTVREFVTSMVTDDANWDSIRTP